MDAEFIDLLEDPQVQVLRHEKPDFAYVLIPETPKSSGGLFRVSGVFKDDEPQFLVVPLAIINGSVPVASITLKSLLLPVLLLVSQTLHAAPWGSEGVNPYRPMKEFWYMLLSGEILVRAQPHVDIDPIWGWGSMTVILLAAAMLVIRRFHPQFDRKTSPSEPWTFARGVRQVLVVTLFVLLSGTTLKAFGPNDALDSPAALGSFMFLSAA